MKNKQSYFLIHFACLMLLIVLPWGSDTFFSSYFLDVATRVLIIWIALLGFDLLAGYAGLVSLGYAMFFGLGAYGAAMSLQAGLSILPLVLLIGIASAGLPSLLVGYFSTRSRGIYFILATLVFAEAAFQLVLNGGSVTGGRNGIFSIPKTPFNLAWWQVDWAEPFSAYYLALLVFAMAYLTARKIVGSPFGSALAAIKSNEDRTAFLGYDVAAVKRRIFVVSSLFAGLAGALWAHHQSYVSPELLHWTFSGQMLIMTWLGGAGTLVGPLIGGAVLTLMADVLSSVMKNWLIIFGLLYILVVMFSPKGLWGLLLKLNNRRRP